MTIRGSLTRLRSHRAVRGTVQGLVVVSLIAAGYFASDRIGGLEEDNVEEQSTSTAISAILAQSCGAASFKELREQGLVEECRLAQEGALADAIPDDALPEPDAEPTDINPDVVADDEDSTPGDVQPPTTGEIAAAVDEWFADNPLSTTPGYNRAIQRSVAGFLTANPPEPGRPPTQGEIRSAVRAALIANPPEDGTDGRGVASVAVDGCDIIFGYSDGTTDRVGPVCGPAPSDERVAQAVVAYCAANGECRGPAGPAGVVRTEDNCQPPDGEFVTDVSTSYRPDDQTIVLTCTSAPEGGILGKQAP